MSGTGEINKRSWGNLGEEVDNFVLWEKRYSMKGRGPKQPEPFVVESAQFMPAGRILDVACGEGRHALYLAQVSSEFKVLGLDRSPTAIKSAQLRAAQLNIPAEFAVRDLEKEFLPNELYSAIVVTRYWQPNLCPLLVRHLLPGGLLIYETYTLEYLRYGDRTRRHLLKSGQLRETFENLGLRIDYYAEVDRPETREYSARLRAVKV
ncbi:MAG: class I SAM-dependent methyltransferase [Candidatus Bruticola sp.]